MSEEDNLRAAQELWGPFSIPVDDTIREIWRKLSSEDMEDALVALMKQEKIDLCGKTIRQDRSKSEDNG